MQTAHTARHADCLRCSVADALMLAADRGELLRRTPLTVLINDACADVWPEQADALRQRIGHEVEAALALHATHCACGASDLDDLAARHGRRVAIQTVDYMINRLW